VTEINDRTCRHHRLIIIQLLLQ